MSFDKVFLKKNKLINQVMIYLFICFAVCTIVCSFFSILLAVSIQERDKASEAEMVSDVLLRMLQSCGKDMILYWADNYNTMEIVYDDLEYLEGEIVNYQDEYGSFLFPVDGLNNRYPDFESMNWKQKKELAEIVFMYMIEVFDSYKQEYNMLYVYYSIPIEGEKLEFILTGCIDGEVRGVKESEIYKLGKIIELQRTTNETIYSVLDTGSTEHNSFTELQVLGKNTRVGIHHYYPLIIDEEVVGVIGVANRLGSIYSEVKGYLNRTFVAFVVSMLLCAICVHIYFDRRVVKEITGIQQGISEFLSSMDDKKLSDNMLKHMPSNEIGILSNELSQMGQALNYYIEENTKTVEKAASMKAELDLAAGIQLSVLPDEFEVLPKEWKLDLFALMKPAKEVGGDFYDFIALDDDHLALLVGDVSGKGISAALFMMTCKLLLNNDCKYSLSPKEILINTNNKIMENNKMEMFVTAWLGILEISTGKLVIGSAGHEYPIVKRKDGSIEVLKYKQGAVMGAMPDLQYVEHEIFLERGDQLVVYTDGVPEATNVSQELYGMDRLVAWTENNDFDNSRDYVEGLLAEVLDYQKATIQFDDITIMSLLF